MGGGVAGRLGWGGGVGVGGAGWALWARVGQGEGGPGGIWAVGEGWYKRSYSQKGCLYARVKNALRKGVG